MTTSDLVVLVAEKLSHRVPRRRNCFREKRPYESSSNSAKTKFGLGQPLCHMNSEHLQLREDPFGASADPRFLFEAESHSRAAATLITNVDGGVRLQVLVSAPGVGKSTLLYCLEESACRNANTVFI